MGGGGVMMWVMLEPDGRWNVKKIEGKIKLDDYIKTIDGPLNYLDNEYGPGRYSFHQDNVSIHKAKKTTNYFEDGKTKLLDWPAKSPDLNRMENAWGMISAHVYDKKHYKDEETLWKGIEDTL